MIEKLWLSVFFSIKPNELDVDLNFLEKCKHKLENNIQNEFYIKEVIKVQDNKKYRINIDGSIHVNIRCFCVVINPVMNSIVEITITDVNKMGFSYKCDKVCIFIPNNNKSIYSINDIIKVKIIGKRIENNILCIGQPIQ